MNPRSEFDRLNQEGLTGRVVTGPRYDTYYDSMVGIGECGDEQIGQVVIIARRPHARGPRYPGYFALIPQYVPPHETTFEQPAQK